MMKHLMAFCVVISLLLLSCTHVSDLDPDQFLLPEVELTDGFCLVSDGGVILNHHDIEYYAYSVHLVYFKDHVSFAEDIVESGFNAVYAGGEKIYMVERMNAYDSYLPGGPMVWNQSMYEDYVMQIDLLRPRHPDDPVDPRLDPRVEEALKKYSQFHAGLACEIVAVRSSEPGHVGLELELKNEDSFDYCFLDPDKMGPGLFHYYTNGLTLRDVSMESFTHQTEVIHPDPWDSWDTAWLSVIESGETVSRTISYTDFDPLPPGAYTALFRFPGLCHNVQKEDLEQTGGRLWLGDLDLQQLLIVE